MNKFRPALSGLAAAAALAGCAPLEPTAIMPDLHPYEHVYPDIPPSTVPVSNIAELLGGHVFVGQNGLEKFDIEDANDDVLDNAVYVMVFASDGRYASCKPAQGRSHATRVYQWWPLETHDSRLKIAISAVATGNNKYETSDTTGNAAIAHAPSTGTTVLFTKNARNGSWWPDAAGHLQVKIPAIAYQYCPDFPPAEALGFEINEAQTALTYPQLLGQDRGQRVIRPDLTVPNAVVSLEQ